MSATDHPSGLRVITADLSQSRPPRWAWKDRLPIGYLSLLIGNEGIGKSSLAAWLVARLTHGDLPGDLRHEPVSVAIIGDEDSFQQVWTPRLEAAGAALDRVKSIERPDGGYIELEADRERIAMALDLEQIQFAFFDSLIDNLGAAVDDWHGKAVRHALAPARKIARDLDVTITGSLHPNKRASSFRELVAGSSAFNAVSRSSLLLAQHPDDETRRVLSRGKGNLSVTPPAVEFTLETHRFQANGHAFEVPRAGGFSTSDLTVDDLIDTTGDRTAEHSKVAEAAEIIEALVPKDGDWHPAAPVYEAAEADDIDKRTVNRAKNRVGLEQRRASTFQAPSEWRWPTDRTPHRTGENSVPSVRSVRSANAPTTYTQDTQDTEDTQNECPECVLSAGEDDDAPWDHDEYLKLCRAVEVDGEQQHLPATVTALSTKRKPALDDEDKAFIAAERENTATAQTVIALAEPAPTCNCDEPLIDKDEAEREDDGRLRCTFCGRWTS